MKRRCRNNFAALPQSRWLAYTATAVATVAGSVATTQADIHYSGKVNLRIDGSHFSWVRHLPRSGGALLEFTRSSFGLGQSNGIGIKGARQASVRGTEFRATKLYHGDKISQGSFSQVWLRVLDLIDHYATGSFAELGVHYAGFEFDLGHGKQYGWARIKTLNTGTENAMNVIDYAWGDPGDVVEAGQKRLSQGEADAVPAEGSLGLLALGGAGLVAWRKRRARAED